MGVEKTITNSMLAKFLSVEFWAGVIVTVFMMGAIWANINGSIAKAQDTAKEASEKVEKLVDDVSEITGDIKVIKSQNAALAEEQTEQRQDIKQILRLLGGNTGRIRSEEDAL